MCKYTTQPHVGYRVFHIIFDAKYPGSFFCCDRGACFDFLPLSFGTPLASVAMILLLSSSLSAVAVAELPRTLFKGFLSGLSPPWPAVAAFAFPSPLSYPLDLANHTWPVRSPLVAEFTLWVCLILHWHVWIYVRSVLCGLLAQLHLFGG